MTPWLVLAGLGAFHGVNPAMGWLFAVALGHGLAVALVVLTVVALGKVVQPRGVALAGGVALVGWAGYHHLYGARHRVRVGMRTGMAGLASWSFLMASAHGAGLMLVPVLAPLTRVDHAHQHGAGMAGGAAPLVTALAAVAVHTGAMLLVTGAVAVVVYEWVGVGFLRRGWINLDLLWTAALAGAGIILIGGAVR